MSEITRRDFIGRIAKYGALLVSGHVIGPLLSYAAEGRDLSDVLYEPLKDYADAVDELVIVKSDAKYTPYLEKLLKNNEAFHYDSSNKKGNEITRDVMSAAENTRPVMLITYRQKNGDVDVRYASCMLSEDGLFLTDFYTVEHIVEAHAKEGVGDVIMTLYNPLSGNVMPADVIAYNKHLGIAMGAVSPDILDESSKNDLKIVFEQPRDDEPVFGVDFKHKHLSKASKRVYDGLKKGKDIKSLTDNYVKISDLFAGVYADGPELLKKTNSTNKLNEMKDYDLVLVIKPSETGKANLFNLNNELVAPLLTVGNLSGAGLPPVGLIPSAERVRGAVGELLEKINSG